jgi:hypothetical protein
MPESDVQPEHGNPVHIMAKNMSVENARRFGTPRSARATAGNKRGDCRAQALRPQRAATIGPIAPRTNSVGIQSTDSYVPGLCYPRPRGAFCK